MLQGGSGGDDNNQPPNNNRWVNSPFFNNILNNVNQQRNTTSNLLHRTGFESEDVPDMNEEVPISENDYEYLDMGDYRDLAKIDKSTRDVTKVLDGNTLEVRGVLDAEYMQELSRVGRNQLRARLNQEIRTMTRNMPTHIGQSEIRGGGHMTPSRAILESRQSIDNYAQFMETMIARVNNTRLHKKKFVLKRHMEMLNTMRTNVKDRFDELLGLPVYDFSIDNTIEAFKDTANSEIYMTFAPLKVHGINMRYREIVEVMYFFAAQEYTRSTSYREEVRRPRLVFEGSDTLTIRQLGRVSYQAGGRRPSLRNIPPDNYNNTLLINLFYNWLIDGMNTDYVVSRHRLDTIRGVLGAGINTTGIDDPEQLVTTIINASPPPENFAAFYQVVLHDAPQDREIYELIQSFKNFLQQDTSLNSLVEFCKVYLNQRIGNFYDNVLENGWMELGFNGGIKEFSRSTFERSVEVRKLQMIIQGGTVEQWLIPGTDDQYADDYFERYYKGFGEEYFKLLVDYQMSKERGDVRSDASISPEVVLSPEEGLLQNDSPGDQLLESGIDIESNRNMALELLQRDNILPPIPTDNWMFPFSNETLRYIQRLGDTVPPNRVLDPAQEVNEDLLRASMSEPITIRTVRGAVLKRFIIDGFYTVIPNTDELIRAYANYMKKLFRAIFLEIYGQEFIDRTNLYGPTDTDINPNDPLDINLYDMIPYHSISLSIRRLDREEEVQTVLNRDNIDFNDDSMFPLEQQSEISTRFMKKPLYDLIEKLGMASGKYSETFNFICQIKIDLLEIYNKSLAFGKLRSAYDLGGRAIPKLREKYILIDTTTEENCIYACCFTAIEFEENYKILENERARQNGASLLKKKILKEFEVNSVDPFFLNTIDENNDYAFNNNLYQAICDYYGRNIEVYNNIFVKFREFTTCRKTKKEPIRLQVHLMHAVLMITREHFDAVYETQGKQLKKDYIKEMYTHFKKDLGIDQCNNLVRTLESDHTKLPRVVLNVYRRKIGELLNNNDQSLVFEKCNSITTKYKLYKDLRQFFKKTLSPEMILNAIGKCRINRKDEPWVEVRATNKGEVWIEAYNKRLTLDELDFLSSNRIIEYQPNDGIGVFKKLEKKENDDNWFCKFGALDLESALNEKNYQICYASGFAYYDKPYLYPAVDDHQDTRVHTWWNDDQNTAIEQIMFFLHSNALKFNGYVIYAHNGGKFDFPIILSQYLSTCDEYWTIDTEKFVEMNGAILSMTLIAKNVMDEEGGKVTITFRDSVRLIPGSLDRICQELKTTHQKLLYPKDDHRYVDHTMINLDNFQSLRWKIEPYLENDCLGLLEFITAFSYNVFKDMHINISTCLTNATLAKKNFFQNYYNPDEYPIYNLPNSYDQILRSCYAGGRVESFVLGKVNSGKVIDDPTSPYHGQQRIFYLDVTSEYPDQGRRDLPYGKPELLDREAAKDLFDTELVSYNDNGTEGYVENDIIKEECFGFVEVEVFCDIARALRTKIKPVHHLYLNPEHPICKGRPDLGNTLLFPWLKSTVRMWICSEEIKYTQKLNLPYIYRVLNVMTFQRAPFLKNLFEDCAVKKEEAGKAGNKCMRQAWKIVMNSTYGFFALRVSNRDSVVVLNEKDAMNWRKYLRDTRLKNIAQYPKYTLCRIEKDIDIIDLNVAVAAFITSYSRMKLHNIITKIESTGHKVYYCDTDSVITNCPLNLCPTIDAELRWDGTGAELGSLKNEALEKVTGIIEGQALKDLFPERGKGTLTKEESKQLKDELNRRILLEQSREGMMEAGFGEAYFMGSKMYYLEMDKTTPEGHKIFYNACAFKGFKKDDYIDHEKKVRAGKCDKGDKEFISDVFKKLNDGEVYSKEQTQFRGGKTSIMNEHTRGGIRTQMTPKKFKKYYIKGVQLENGNDLINVIPHVI